LDIGTQAVRESVFEGHVQPPKTHRTLRTIPLGSHAMAALAAQYRDAESSKHQPENAPPSASARLSANSRRHADAVRAESGPNGEPGPAPAPRVGGPLLQQLQPTP
jgi:hypothetical protein